jgi:hypothetical protein
MIVRNYIPTVDQPTKIAAGIYTAQCIEIKDSTSKNGNAMSELICQVEHMKLRWRYVDALSVAWKNTQARHAFGFKDEGTEKIEFDTQDFVGKLAKCLVGYSANLSEKGEPYLELLEFVPPGQEEAAQQKLEKLIAAEKQRRGLNSADEILF